MRDDIWLQKNDYLIIVTIISYVSNNILFKLRSDSEICHMGKDFNWLINN